MSVRRAVGRMIYACLMGTTAVVIFSVKTRHVLLDLTRRESGDVTVNRNGAIVKRENSQFDKNCINNSYRCHYIGNTSVTFKKNREALITVHIGAIAY